MQINVPFISAEAIHHFAQFDKHCERSKRLESIDQLLPIAKYFGVTFEIHTSKCWLKKMSHVEYSN